MPKYRDQDNDNPVASTARTPEYDTDGYAQPTSPVRADHNGVVVNSPLNKPAKKYKSPEPLGIHRSGNNDQSKMDANVSRLRRENLPPKR